MPLTDRAHKRSARLIKAVVARWNPLSLLGGEHGAPPEEFDEEVAALVRYSRWFWTPDDATEAIFRVFQRAFGAGAVSRQECHSVGEELFAGLGGAALLPSTEPPPVGSWRLQITSVTLLAGTRAIVFFTPSGEVGFGVGLRSQLNDCPLEPGVEQPRALDDAGKQLSLFAVALADPSDLSRFRPGEEATLVTPR